MASADEFVAQAERAERVLRWDCEHVSLLTRLRSGRQPIILDLFCAGGAVSLGVSRLACAPVGVDIEEQPSYVERLGEDRFVRGDALDRDVLRSVVRRFRPIGVWSSPPCEGSSTATFGGKPSRAERLIAATRDALVELGVPFVIENVRGASSELEGDLLILYGQDFGLHTERPRLFESGGGLSLRQSAFLATGGRALRRRSCLGARARYRRRDCFGRTWHVPCCEGNLYAIHGDSVRGGTAADHAAAMGVDAAHMPYDHLVKAVPPAYASFVVGQMVRLELRRRFGISALSYDEALSDLPEARRSLRHLMRGAGGTSASLGLSSEVRREDTCVRQPVEEGPTYGGRVYGDDSADDLSSGPSWSWSEIDFRELDATSAGAFSGSVLSPGVQDWNAQLRASRCLRAVGPDTRLQGGNWLCVASFADAPTVAGMLVRSWSDEEPPRCTIVGLPCEMPRWRTLLSGLPAGTLRSGPTIRGHSTLVVGARLCPPGVSLDWDHVRAGMDPIERGEVILPAGRKSAIAWTPLDRPDPEAWARAGVRSDVVDLIRDGVRVMDFEGDSPWADVSVDREFPTSEDPDRPPPAESGQYAFRDWEFFVRGTEECDRALAAGHLEPVPDHLVDWALSQSPAHPWTVVLQHGDK